MMILMFAVATIAFSLYLNRSWMGFAFRAVADDEQAARTIAIPASTYKLVAFAIGTAIAGLAGGLYAYFTQFIVPDSFGFILSVTLMAMVVIGGTGSTWGVVAAAIILTLLPEAFRFINDYRLLIYGGLLMLVMRFAPGGLAGIVVVAHAEAARAHDADTLEVEDVSIRFGGVQALADVSFSVHAGEFVGLIGPNGAGKTTLLKIIAGVLKPDTGRVLLDGEDVTRLADRRAREARPRRSRIRSCGRSAP